MKQMKVMYCFGSFLSMLVGIWHFTVPWMFQWAEYIPYENLLVSIYYVNFCFSFLLTGISLIMLLWRRKVFDGNGEAMLLYGFFVLLWICRIGITFVWPCPPDANKWMNYGQLMGSVAIAFLLTVPFIGLTKARTK